MRAFIAIEIPTAVKTALAELQADLRETGAEISWTAPDNIHITLKFLGEIDKQQFTEIEKTCRQTAVDFNTFGLSIDGTGVFPNPRHPRVFWVGLSGDSDILGKMQERLDERLEALGFDPDEKDFRPHLTIGRVKSNKNVAELLQRAQKYSLPSLVFPVNEIMVMKSDLHPTGAVYTELARVKLGS